MPSVDFLIVRVFRWAIPNTSAAAYVSRPLMPPPPSCRMFGHFNRGDLSGDMAIPCESSTISLHFLSRVSVMICDHPTRRA
jgi:hypothetical protein